LNVIRESNGDFSNKMDTLLSRARISPIYGSVHSDYYSIYSGKDESISGLMTEINGRPEYGFLYSQNEDGLSNGYFGMPAVAVYAPTSPEIMEFSATNLTKALLNEILFTIRSNRYGNEGVRVLLNKELANTFVFEEILKIASDCSLYFTRVLDLEHRMGSWSNSVKVSVNLAKNNSQSCLVRDSFSSDAQDLERGLEELRKLHLEASGRETRSRDTWQAQLNSLIEGSATIVTAYHAGDPISSSLFMHSLRDVYYAVSASVNRKDIAKGHFVMKSAIEHFRERNFKSLHLGTQYSQFTGKASAKDLGIERFKGLFGGSLEYYFVVSI